MKINEITEGQKANSYTRMLKLMDAVFGLSSDQPSKFRRVKQVFDERTGEHVIYLEYRAQAKNQSAIQRKPARPKERKRKKKQT